jgi:hypothetical protein
MATFSILSTEMKAHIFSFIRLELDQATVCLVSHEWREIMAPLLWESLTFEYQSISTAKFITLIRPDSGIIRHVRRIFIDYDPESLDDSIPQHIQAAIELIINTLPKNTLRSFRSRVALAPRFLLNLLRNQQKMTGLEVPTDDPNENVSIDSGIVTHGAWISTALCELKRLSVYIGSGDYTYQHSAYMIRNAPKLIDLCIDSDGDEQAPIRGEQSCDAFGGPYADDVAVQPLQLTRFRLQWISLSLSHGRLLKYVNFPGLRSLALICCHGIGPFLMAIATQLSLSCNLIELGIVMPQALIVQDDDVVQGIEAVLDSCSGLQSLWINVDKARMVEPSCITRHGQTLRKLGISIDPENAVYYSVSDLHAILTSASHLEELAVHIPPIEMGSLQSLGTNFNLRVPYNGYFDVPTLLAAFLVCQCSTNS